MATISIPSLGSGATLGGDGAAPLSAFTLPAGLRTGLVRMIFPGSGLKLNATALDDFSDLEGLAARVGLPTRTSGGYACDPSNNFDLGVVDTASISMAMIARRTTTVATGYCGNFKYIDTITPPPGAGFWSNNAGTSLAFTAGRSGVLPAGNPQASITAALDSWGLYLGRASTSGATIIDNLTAGTINTNAGVAGTPRLTNTNNITAGAVDGLIYDGAPEIALAMVWNRALDDAERSSLTTWARAYAATLGITV